jgi:hypothetical protein
MDGDHKTTHRPSRLGLYALPAVIALLAIGTIVWWFIATHLADQGFDRWLQAEDAAGRHWTCDDRGMAGFPFRIELSCGRLALKTTKGRVLDASVGGLLVVAQTYDPRAWLVDLKSPLTLAASSNDPLTVTWSAMRASLHVEDFKTPDRVSWAADHLGAAHGSDLPLLQADHLEWHIRKIGADSTAPGDLDLAANLKGLVITALANHAPVDGDLALHLVHGAVFEAPVDVAALEAWRTGGGQVMLDHASLVQGASKLLLSGQLGIDDTHHLAGRLDATATNIGDLVKGAGQMGAMIAGIEGEVKLPLLFQKGRMMMGPLKLADLPALY